jgi:FAD:protein FMN transferase
MNDPQVPSRRDLLTGRAVRQALRRAGDELADAVIDAGEQERSVPVGQETLRLETRAMACSWGVFLNPPRQQVAGQHAEPECEEAPRVTGKSGRGDGGTGGRGDRGERLPHPVAPSPVSPRPPAGPRQVMVASDALDVVHHVEHLLTVYRDDSEIARINREAADSPQTVSPELFEFLLRNRELWERTGGAYDPASGELLRVWKQARREGQVPEAEDVERAVACSGMRHVMLNEADRSVSLDRLGVLFDFGASGKGYAIDLAAGHLLHEEVPDFLVHGGHSSLRAHGDHAGLGAWPVGIKNPLMTRRRYATVLLQDEGMSTSGSNIQYFRHAGKRYGHILDPRTGWPAESFLSVTVIASTALEADVLSTAFYVMGLDNALRYCEDRQEIGAILVPPPTRGQRLEPIVKNIPGERLFWEPA